MLSDSPMSVSFGTRWIDSVTMGTADAMWAIAMHQNARVRSASLAVNAGSGLSHLLCPVLRLRRLMLPVGHHPVLLRPVAHHQALPVSQ